MEAGLMRTSMTVLLALALLLAWAAPAGAQATKTPVTSVSVFEEVIDEGTARVTEGGILVVRNQVQRGSETFEIEGEEHEGEFVATLNLNLNLETLQGTMFGTLEATVPGLGPATGTFHGVIRGGLASGRIVLHGETGAKLFATGTEVAPGVFESEGVILEPAGHAG
jgi:hypothetical protein